MRGKKKKKSISRSPWERDILRLSDFGSAHGAERERCGGLGHGKAGEESRVPKRARRRGPWFMNL